MPVFFENGFTCIKIRKKVQVYIHRGLNLHNKVLGNENFHVLKSHLHHFNQNDASESLFFENLHHI